MNRPRKPETDAWGRFKELPWNTAIKLIPENDGTYSVRSFTDVGCYPIYYFTTDHTEYCPACVQKDIAVHSNRTAPMWCEVGVWIIGSSVNWENPDLMCAHCEKKIESAYAEEAEYDYVQAMEQYLFEKSRDSGSRSGQINAGQNAAAAALRLAESWDRVD